MKLNCCYVLGTFLDTNCYQDSSGVFPFFFSCFFFFLSLEENIARLYNFWFIISCLTVLPVASSVCPPHFFIPSVRMVSSSENLVLEVILACQSCNNAEKLNVISISSKLYVFTEYNFICIICNVLNLCLTIL